MNHTKLTFNDPNQTELFGIVWLPPEYPFHLRVNDLFRFDERLCRVIRINESCATVLMNRPERDFKTRFDKPVKFRQLPGIIHISPNSAVEILYRKRV